MGDRRVALPWAFSVRVNMERGCGRYTVRVWSMLLCNYSLLCLSVAFQMRTVQITNSPPHRAFPPAVFYPYCSQCPMPYSLACGSTNRHRLFLHVIKAHVQFRSQKKGQVLEGRALVGDKAWLCSPLLAWSSLCSLDWPRTLTLNCWGYCGSPLFLHTVFLFFCPMRKHSGSV